MRAKYARETVPNMEACDLRCLVTGASGFIGSHLARFLLGQGCQVGILVRPQSNLWRIQDIAKDLQFLTGDLTQVGQVAKELGRFAPDVVFHLGWYGVAGTRRNDASQIDRNLYGSVNLIHAASQAGCRCWIGLGSQAEYGVHNAVISEETLPQPQTLYGVTKLCTGLLGRKLCEEYGMRFGWLRLFAAYGPMDDPNYLIPYVIHTLLKGDKPALTSGEQCWDYLYVRDVVTAIWSLATSPEAHGIFNLGSGAAVNVRYLVKCISDLINPDLPIGFGELAYAPDQIMLLQADIRRLIRATNWVPAVSLAQGLQETVSWYQSNSSSGRTS